MAVEIKQSVDQTMKRTYCVFNQTRESFLSLGVTRADTRFARLKGLLGRLRLRSDEGLWVVPSRGIHTIGLLVPIDLVYLDAEHRVIRVVEHLGTFRVGPIRLESASVLELPTRSIYSSHTQVGDQLLICSAEAMEAYSNGCQSRSVSMAVSN
jgi:uncharacterized membrane protein (UPF0127 family)